jgi:hypothetical protein
MGRGDLLGQGVEGDVQVLDTAFGGAEAGISPFGLGAVGTGIIVDGRLVAGRAVPLVDEFGIGFGYLDARSMEPVITGVALEIELGLIV